MELTITLADHQYADVRRLGIPVDGPYLEDVAITSCGPSVVALVRRGYQMASRSGGRVDVSYEDMARSIGLRGKNPTDPESQFSRTLARAHSAVVAKFVPGERHAHLELYRQVRPLSRRQLERRCPDFVLERHAQLVSDHGGQPDHPVAPPVADPGTVRITACEYPRPGRRKAGIPVEGPYLADVLVARVGPSTAAVTRTAHRLARLAGGSVDVPAESLAHSVGLHPKVLDRTLRRAHQFSLAEVAREGNDFDLTVWDQVPAVRIRSLGELPAVVSEEHYRVLAPIDRLLAEQGVDLGDLIDSADRAPARTLTRTPSGNGPGTPAARALAQLGAMTTHQPPAPTPTAPPSL